MRVVTLDAEDDFDGWRDAVRGLVLDHVPPDQVVWQVGDEPGELFAGQVPHAPPTRGRVLGAAAVHRPRAQRDPA